jgi:hypothetical protein
VTEAERQRVVELHGQGMSRAVIAREVGRAPSTVGHIAALAGLSFDRAKTRVAVEAKQIDNRQRRGEIVNGLYREAAKILARLGTDSYDATGTAPNGSVVVTTIRTVPAHDLRHLSSSLATLTGAAVRLEQVDADTGAEAGRTMISELQVALGLAYAAMVAEEEERSEGDG